MRVKHSIRNISVGLISQILLVIVGFVSRKIFIITLGNEMLGINGLFTSIISMLSLTELGIGTAIICNLYKPLADRDETKIISLVQLFAKTYRVIGLVVVGLGLAVMPFLNGLIKENLDPVFLSTIFLLFVVDTVVPYFFAHKRSLIFADQKNYIVTLVSSASTITFSILQIIILYLTHNYVLFLCIRIGVKLIENTVITYIANRRYPFIKTHQKHPIDTETKKGIIANTKALALHYVGKYLIDGTDNIIISRFLGVVVVGFYSNYFLIIFTLTNFLNQFSNGLIASFGNMIAKESSEKSYDVFKKANFINFAIFNFAAISLMSLLNPFISMWIDTESLLSIPVVVVLAINFYIIGISSVVSSMRASAGLFRPDRYLHLLMAALNLIVSIVLVQVIGIIGVFLGTLLCLIIKEISVLPSIVYRNIYKVSVKKYYAQLVKYFLTTVVAGAITMYICTGLITGGGIPMFLLRCLVCLIIPNIFILLLYRNTDEYKYSYAMIKDMVAKRLIKRRA